MDFIYFLQAEKKLSLLLAGYKIREKSEELDQWMKYQGSMHQYMCDKIQRGNNLLEFVQ